MKRINLVYLLVLMGFFIFSCTDNFNNKSSIDDFIAKESLQNSIAFRSAINIGQQHNEALEHILLQYNGDLWNADTIRKNVCLYFNCDPHALLNDPDLSQQFQMFLDSLFIYDPQDALDYIVGVYNASFSELFELGIIGEGVKEILLELPLKTFDHSINWDSIKNEAINLCEGPIESIVVENIFLIGAYSYAFWTVDYPNLVNLNPHLPSFVDDISAIGGPAADMAGGAMGAVKFTRKHWKTVQSGAWTHAVPEENFWELCGDILLTSVDYSAGMGVGRGAWNKIKSWF